MNTYTTADDFHKKIMLCNYPVPSQFSLSGKVCSAIFRDTETKIVMDQPDDLSFIPLIYSSNASLSLTYIDNRFPPTIRIKSRAANPFTTHQVSLHFYKKVTLKDYPVPSRFILSGDTYMCIFQDHENKKVVKLPTNVNFIPANYTPDAYLLLYYVNINNPPHIYVNTAPVEIVNSCDSHDIDYSVYMYSDSGSDSDQYSLQNSGNHKSLTSHQIKLTLPKWTIDSKP